MTNKNIKNPLFYLLKKHVFLTVLLSVFIILVSLSSLLPPIILQKILDDFVSPGILNNTYNKQDLILWTIFYFLSYVLIYICTIIENILVDTLGQKMIHDLRYEMIKKIQVLPSSYFRHNGTGVMTSRVMDDVNSIETLFSDGLVSLVVSLFKILSITISIFIFSWALGLMVLILIPIVYFITNFFRKRTFKFQIQSRQLKNEETNCISESIDNIRVLNNLEKKKYQEDKFKNMQYKDINISFKTAIYDSIFSPLIMMLKALVIALVTILVAFSVLNNQSFAFISIGTFAASITLISNIFAPIQELGQELEVMQEGLSGIKRVYDYLKMDEEKEKNLKLTAETILQNKASSFIKAEHLSFKYDDGDELIFDNVNFEINKNESITIIGRTGAGKTTLFRILLSLIYPTNGTLLINNYNVSDIPNSEKRKIFGYVKQEYSPIPGTILDQITLHDKNINMTQVKIAMKKAHLDNYVTNNIKGGYDAKFSLSLFSQGQLQLLNLARALVLDPPILLLDEISANLDSETEKEVITAIKEAGKDKTVLSISHRLSDQINFTKTIEINNGKVKTL